MVASRTKSTQVDDRADESFVWDNSRYESMAEKHTGFTADMLDRLICIGLFLFGAASFGAAIVATVLHLWYLWVR